MNEHEEKNKGKKLTPEQQAILDGLIGPDAEVKMNMPWDENFQRRILDSLLVDEEFLFKSARFLKPDYWSTEPHVLIAKVLFVFYKQHEALPERFVIEKELLSRIKDKDDALKLLYRAELNTTYEFFVPGLASRKYLMDKLIEFGQCQEVKIAYGEYTKLFRENDAVFSASGSSLSLLRG
jgi:hypothetical protein